MTDPLEAVRTAAANAASSRSSLDQAIAEAHKAGHSLRAIAEAAGLSHEQIRKIVTKGASQ